MVTVGTRICMCHSQMREPVTIGGGASEPRNAKEVLQMARFFGREPRMYRRHAATRHDGDGTRSREEAVGTLLLLFDTTEVGQFESNKAGPVVESGTWRLMALLWLRAYTCIQQAEKADGGDAPRVTGGDRLGAKVRGAGGGDSREEEGGGAVTKQKKAEEGDTSTQIKKFLVEKSEEIHFFQEAATARHEHEGVKCSAGSHDEKRCSPDSSSSSTSSSPQKERAGSMQMSSYAGAYLNSKGEEGEENRPPSQVDLSSSHRINADALKRQKSESQDENSDSEECDPLDDEDIKLSLLSSSSERISRLLPPKCALPSLPSQLPPPDLQMKQQMSSSTEHLLTAKDPSPPTSSFFDGDTSDPWMRVESEGEQDFRFLSEYEDLAELMAKKKPSPSEPDLSAIQTFPSDEVSVVFAPREGYIPIDESRWKSLGSEGERLGDQHDYAWLVEAKRIFCVQSYKLASWKYIDTPSIFVNKSADGQQAPDDDEGAPTSIQQLLGRWEELFKEARQDRFKKQVNSSNDQLPTRTSNLELSDASRKSEGWSAQQDLDQLQSCSSQEIRGANHDDNAPIVKHASKDDSESLSSSSGSHLKEPPHTAQKTRSSILLVADISSVGVPSAKHRMDASADLRDDISFIPSFPLKRMAGPHKAPDVSCPIFDPVLSDEYFENELAYQKKKIKHLFTHYRTRLRGLSVKEMTDLNRYIVRPLQSTSLPDLRLYYVDCKRLTLDELQNEPLFLSMSLHDISQHYKLSESFNFELNSKQLLDQIHQIPAFHSQSGSYVSEISGETMGTQCIFQVTGRLPPSAYVIICVSRCYILEEQEKRISFYPCCSAPSSKLKKPSPASDAASAPTSTPSGILTRRLYCWAAVPFSSLPQAGPSSPRADDGAHGFQFIPAKYANSYQSLYQLLNDRDLKRSKVLSGTLHLEASQIRDYYSFPLCSHVINSSLDPVCPSKQPMRDEALAEDNSDPQMSIDSSAGTTSDAAPKEEDSRSRSARASSEFRGRQLPREDGWAPEFDRRCLEPSPATGRTSVIKHLHEFGSSNCDLHLSELNNMYVQLCRAYLRKSDVSSSKVQIYVEARFKESDMSSTGQGVCTWYGLSHSQKMCPSVLSHVQANDKPIEMYDEFKLKLPIKLTKMHHILFIFYELEPKRCRRTVIGYAVLPLLKSENQLTIANTAGSKRVGTKVWMQLLLVPTLPNYYLTAATSEKVQYYQKIDYPGALADTKRYKFLISIELASSIYSTDPALSRFFFAFERYPRKTSKNYWVLLDAIGDLPRSDKTAIFKNFVLLFNLLLWLVCHSAVDQGSLGGHLERFAEAGAEEPKGAPEFEEGASEGGSAPESKVDGAASQRGRADEQVLVSEGSSDIESSQELPDSDPAISRQAFLVLLQLVSIVSGMTQQKYSFYLRAYANYMFDNEMISDWSGEAGSEGGAPCYPFESICYHYTQLLLSDNPLVRQFDHTWFLFSLVFKSMLLHLHARGLVPSDPPAERSAGPVSRREYFSDSFEHILSVMAHLFLTRKNVRGGIDHTMAMGIFLKNLLSICDRGVILAIICQYLRLARMEQRKASIAEICKYAFLKVLSSYEHWIPLNMATAEVPLEEMGRLGLAKYLELVKRKHVLVGELIHEVEYHYEQHLSAEEVNLFSKERGGEVGAQREEEKRAAPYAKALEKSQDQEVLPDVADSNRQATSATEAQSARRSGELAPSYRASSKTSSGSQSQDYGAQLMPPQLQSASAQQRANPLFSKLIVEFGIQAIIIMRHVMSRHEFDSRIADPRLQEYASNMYFPLVCKMVSEPSALDRMSSQECGDWFMCFLYVLKYGSRGLWLKWWELETQKNQVNLWNVLIMCVLRLDQRSVSRQADLLALNLITLIISRYHPMLNNAVEKGSGKGEGADSLAAHPALKKIVYLLRIINHKMIGCSGLSMTSLPMQASQEPLRSSLGERGKSKAREADKEKMPSHQWTNMYPNRKSESIQHLFAPMQLVLNRCAECLFCLDAGKASQSDVKHQSDLLEPLLLDFVVYANHPSVLMARVYGTSMLYLVFQKADRLLKGEYDKLHVELTIAVSRMIGISDSMKVRRYSQFLGSLDALQAAITCNTLSENLEVSGRCELIKKVMKRLEGEEMAVAGRSSFRFSEQFTEKVLETLVNIRGLIDSTIKIKEDLKDPELMQDLYLNVVQGFEASPELQMTWLDNLSQLHVNQEDYEEAAQCKLHIAAYVLQYLMHEESPLGQLLKSKLPPNFEKFVQLAPNVEKQWDPRQHPPGTSNWHLKHVFSLLSQAVTYFDRATRYELAVETCQAMNVLYTVRRDWSSRLKNMSVETELCQKLANSNPSAAPIHPVYFRVVFYGSKWDNLNGKQFIYKKTAKFNLSLFKNQLEYYYKERMSRKSKSSQRYEDRANRLSRYEPESLRFAKDSELNKRRSSNDQIPPPSSSSEPHPPQDPNAPSSPFSFHASMLAKKHSQVKNRPFDSILIKTRDPSLADLIILSSNETLDLSTLDPRKSYIQMTGVTPYFEIDKTQVPTSNYDRHFNVSQFLFEVPYTEQGQIGITDDLTKQYKKKFIFQTTHAFPYLKTRLQVTHSREIVLSPIENAIELINLQSLRLRTELESNPTRLNSLQQVIQGSVVSMVNPGPLKICDSFLNLSLVKQGLYSRAHLHQLCQAMNTFVKLCGFAIKLNKSIIDETHEKFQLVVQEFYSKLEKIVKESTSSIMQFLSQNPS